jgi:hypothetical protein
MFYQNMYIYIQKRRSFSILVIRTPHALLVPPPPPPTIQHPHIRRSILKTFFAKQNTFYHKLPQNVEFIQHTYFDILFWTSQFIILNYSRFSFGQVELSS